MTGTGPSAVRFGLDRWVWITGCLVGAALAGWTFDGDLLLNVDQVIGSKIPMPSGLVGEGSELPRRVPFYIPFALLSEAVPGPALVGAFLVIGSIGAVIGMYRVAGGDAPALVAALFYGLSPFLLTRAAVGHLPVVAACALVPWAIGSLRSSTGRRPILIWGLLFGLLGSSGAVVGLVVLALAVVHSSRTVGNGMQSLALLALTQAPWLGPGLVALTNNASLPTTPSSPFATRASGLTGPLRIFSGGGFFIDAEDVANRAWVWAAALGLVVLASGFAGLVARGKFDLVASSGCVGLVLVFVSAQPVGHFGWYWLTELGPLGLFRDSQKFWPLVGVATGVGLAHTLRSVPLALTRQLRFAYCGLLLLVLGSAWPGLFGAQGRLNAHGSPAGWSQISTALDGEPGTIVALPWRRYERLDLSQGRNVLQPGPWLLGSQVVISGDPGLGPGFLERDDVFQQALPRIDRAVRAGDPIAADLRSLGVEWVVVSGSADAKFYRRLGSEIGVETVVDQDVYLLFRIG